MYRHVVASVGRLGVGTCVYIVRELLVCMDMHRLHVLGRGLLARCDDRFTHAPFPSKSRKNTTGEELHHPVQRRHGDPAREGQQLEERPSGVVCE